MEKILKHIILPAFFALFIISPLANWYTGWLKDIKSTENRALSPKPNLELDKLNNFPARFDSFFNDNFPMRNYLIDKLLEIKTMQLGISPLPDKVIAGKDGWLFMIHNDYDTYMGRDTLSYSGIRMFTREIVRRANYLKMRNCKYYYVIVPTKYSIYPEYLPGYFSLIKHQSLSDQIKDFLTKAGIAVIDLRQELIKAKSGLPKDETLFLISDNHWNGFGGYVASCAIINRIREDLPAVEPPLPIDSFNIYRRESVGGNLAAMLSLNDKYLETQVKLICKSRNLSNGIRKGYAVPADFTAEFEIAKQCSLGNKLKVLVIRDSFGDAIVPVLSVSFQQSVYIFDKWKYGLNEEIVNAEKPDIFIQMPIESLADNIWKNLSVY